MLQEIREMIFEETYNGWSEVRLTHKEAARLLGISDRNFCLRPDQYHDNALDNLVDRHLTQELHLRTASLDEVVAMTLGYRKKRMSWNLKEFYTWYKRDSNSRFYTWI